MTYLLDTCIVSKLRKLRFQPDPALQDWIVKHPESSYFLSVLTLGEIQAGIAKLNPLHPEEQKRRMLLEDWLFGDLVPRFQNRIIDIDLQVVFTWGKIQGGKRKKGHNTPIIDGLIAATAVHHGLIVVTENSKDFEKSGAEIFNPWM